MSSPYMEQFLKRERNVLLMYDDVDEYVVNAVEGFKGAKFVSVDSADKDFELDLDKPEDCDQPVRELTESEQKELHTFIKDVLSERVQEVKFSDRLVSSPAIVTSILTPHMRKMMKQLMAGKEDTGMGNVPVTLELSAKHHIITTLHTIMESNEPVARIAVEQLYDNACIAAGTLDDPRILLTRLNKVLEMFVYQGAGFDYAKNEYVTSDDAATPPIEGKGETAKEAAEEKGASSSKPADEKAASGAKFEEKPTTIAKPADDKAAGNSKFEEVKSS